ncbi:MAG: hypothetical protein IPJ43_05160 [Saprospiraceae bacterium]|nr:hypothetical protein [Saprospiraceae bacterium]
MWQAIANSHPPPNAKPLTAAITGNGSFYLMFPLLQNSMHSGLILY